MSETTPYSVSEFIELLNEKLRQASGTIIGEVSELTVSAKGHVYFTIKDKEKDANLPCTIWSSKYALCGVKLERGLEVQVTGTPDFYAPFGKLSFQVNKLELVGEGALKRAYDKLKQQLQKEGLLEISKKRPLPDFVKTIGVVTSSKGAVIHDFSNNLGKNGFAVKIMHTNVEGQSSGADLIMSLRAFKKENIDVLVLIRGGGSMQSLSGFDNETLVREIAAYPVPVLAGIGHHQDVPLSALVADIQESTPSLVAVRLNESWDRARREVTEIEAFILNQYGTVLKNANAELQETYSKSLEILNRFFDTYRAVQENIERQVIILKEKVKQHQQSLGAILKPMFVSIAKQINTGEEKILILPKLIGKLEPSISSQRNLLLYEYRKKIYKNFTDSLSRHSENLEELEKILKNYNPERQLQLGYSILRKGNLIIRSIKDLKAGDDLRVQVSDGTINTVVK